MKKALLLLLLGLAAGYFIGFKDAQAHKKDIVSRLVARTGGSNRSRFSNDVDASLEGVDRP